MEIIENIVDSYVDMNAWEMVEKTHNEDPWNNTVRNEIIKVTDIKDYFKHNKSRIYG